VQDELETAQVMDSVLMSTNVSVTKDGKEKIVEVQFARVIATVLASASLLKPANALKDIQELTVFSGFVLLSAQDMARAIQLPEIVLAKLVGQVLVATKPFVTKSTLVETTVLALAQISATANVQRILRATQQAKPTSVGTAPDARRHQSASINAVDMGCAMLVFVCATLAGPQVTARSHTALLAVSMDVANVQQTNVFVFVMRVGQARHAD
jgi:hypothetical protein